MCPVSSHKNVQQMRYVHLHSLSTDAKCTKRPFELLGLVTIAVAFLSLIRDLVLVHGTH